VAPKSIVTDPPGSAGSDVTTTHVSVFDAVRPAWSPPSSPPPGIGEIDPRLLDLSILREIAPDDEMCNGPPQGYFLWALSALNSIMAAMRTAGVRQAPERILDLPCGHGRVLRMLKAAFPHAEITACDLNRAGVDFCAQAFGAKPVYSSEEPQDISIADRFDLIWVGSLFTHLSASRWHEFLAFFCEHLEPGGMLVFTANGRSILDAIRRRERSFAITDVPLLALECEREGFAYQDYTHTDAYGLSLSLIPWVGEALASHPQLQLVTYTEGGVNGRQDAIGCRRRVGAAVNAAGREVPDPKTLGSLEGESASVAQSRQSPAYERVLVGDGGWLFLRHAGDGELMHGRASLPGTVERWSRELQRRASWSEEHGSQYLALFAPDKEAVYADKLPSEIAARLAPPEQRIVPSLQSRLAAAGNVPTLYPLDRLRRARGSLETYNRTDTGWTGWGAFVAYRVIVEELRQGDAAVDVFGEDRISFRLIERSGDLGEKLDPIRHSRFLIAMVKPTRAELVYDNRVRNNGRVFFFKRTDAAARSLARCLVFGDSFGYSLARLLAEAFRETVVVHASRGIDYGLAEALSPDVLLTVTVERFATEPPQPEVSVRDLVAEKVTTGDCEDPLGTFPEPNHTGIVADDLLPRAGVGRL
jgi:SAM-dependent methyltransferase